MLRVRQIRVVWQILVSVRGCRRNTRNAGVGGQFGVVGRLLALVVDLSLWYRGVAIELSLAMKSASTGVETRVAECKTACAECRLKRKLPLRVLNRLAPCSMRHFDGTVVEIVGELGEYSAPSPLVRQRR